MVVWLGMGNCFSMKRKKSSVAEEHPTVSRWLASCDFASAPDIEEYSTGLSTGQVIVDSILAGDFLEGDCDGYITALENLESEDDPCDDVIGAEPSSSVGTQKTTESSTFIDENSIYETSDELVPNEPGLVPETACERNYDARPICPLPTPLRKNLISPRVNLETLVDRKGRVRRTERVKLYLDQIRQTAQHLKS
uniref:BHLH domain-containing protein n=1 Tax=Angiostrongylus cantonensis TaxID=6313 RepID=A0A0K0D9H7_ANGCA